jgi:DNA-binding NarL/FixJ family response regulator
MRETVVNGTGQAVFVPGEWRSLAACLGLSPRECGIVRAVFDGNSEKDAAERLGLSPHTVHTYLWRIYRKLHVQSREELLVRVFAEFRSLPKRPPNSGPRKRPDARHRAL